MVSLELPQDKFAVESGGGQASEVASSSRAALDGVDVVLVLGVQLALDGGLSSLILSLEHVEGSASAGALLSGSGLLLVEVSADRPGCAFLNERAGEVVVASTNKCVLVDPNKIAQRELLKLQDSGLTRVGVHDGHSGVVA